MKPKTLLLGGLALAIALTAGLARADDDDWGARVIVPAPGFSIGYWDRGSGLSFGINGPMYYGPPVTYYAPPPRVYYYGAPAYYGPPGHWRHRHWERWHDDDHRGWGRGHWDDD